MNSLHLLVGKVEFNEIMKKILLENEKLRFLHENVKLNFLHGFRKTQDIFAIFASDKSR